MYHVRCYSSKDCSARIIVFPMVNLQNLPLRSTLFTLAFRFASPPQLLMLPGRCVLFWFIRQMLPCVVAMP
jgi:hypothetical protein